MGSMTVTTPSAAAASKIGPCSSPSTRACAVGAVSPFALQERRDRLGGLGERERLDQSEAGLGGACDRTGGVGGDGFAQRVELQGDGGRCHEDVLAWGLPDLRMPHQAAS